MSASQMLMNVPLAYMTVQSRLHVLILMAVLAVAVTLGSLEMALYALVREHNLNHWLSIIIMDKNPLQILTSVKLVLTVVVRMQTVPILMAATHVLVDKDSLGMEQIASVSVQGWNR